MDQVAGEDTGAVEFRFSRSVLTDFDVDVVHVLDSHLETLLGTKHAGPVQRVLAVRALTRNLRKHGIALVRTLTGLPTDEPASRASSLARRMLDKSTTAFVVFHPSTPTPDPARTTVIPHAHYGERFKGYPRAESVAGLVLCIARGRLPGAAVGLVGIPRATRTADVAVRFAGEADERLEQVIRSGAALYPASVSMRLQRLSDGARVQEISAAELVIVPEVGSMTDLQTIFLALTLNRPVLTARSRQTAVLAEEVGPEWVHLTDGLITAASVDEALAVLRERPEGSRPGLEGRDLQAVNARYAAVFRAVGQSVRGRVRLPAETGCVDGIGLGTK